MCLGIVKKVIVGFNKKSKEIDKYIEAHSVSPSKDIHDDKMIKNLKKVCFVEGGLTRQETVHNCLKFIDENYKGYDSWRDYLNWQMKHIDGEDDNSKNKNPRPPYGKRFCAGHPSPNAIKELCDRIYEELDK